MEIAVTNAVIHELTHVATGHSPWWKPDYCTPPHHSPNTGHCVYDSEMQPFFYYQNGIRNIITKRGATWESPWHSLEDINAMRREMGLKYIPP